MGNKASTLGAARKRQVKVVKLLEGEGIGLDDYASEGDSQSSNSTDLASEIDPDERLAENEAINEEAFNMKTPKEMRGDIYANIRTLRNRGDLDGAKALVREWLKDNAHDIHARMSYGRILWIQGDLHHAEQEFQHALGKNPKNVHVLKVYATFLASVHKDYKLASMLVSKAIDVEPHSRQLALLSAQIAKRGGMMHDEGKAAEVKVAEVQQHTNWQRHLPRTELRMPSEIKQGSKSNHLRRQMYESSFLQSRQDQQDRDARGSEDDDDGIGTLGGILPPCAWRGKVENVFCDLEEAVDKHPPTRVMKSRNQLWPEDWYCTDTVPSEAAAATHRKLTKEDKEFLEKAQRWTKWFKPHETKETEFKQAKGKGRLANAHGGKFKLQQDEEDS